MHVVETAIPIQAEPALEWSRAVDAMVREHGRLVYRIAFAALRHEADAEDACQEVFVRVWRARAELAGVQDQKAWLARITWRLCTDRLRARPRAHAAQELPDVADSRANAEHALHARQTNEIVQRLVAALPDELREPLLLSAVEELNSQQIAAVLGASDATIRGRLRRARQLLREKLEGILEERHVRGS